MKSMIMMMTIMSVTESAIMTVTATSADGAHAVRVAGLIVHAITTQMSGVQSDD
jgi:hypothetical protein